VDFKYGKLVSKEFIIDKLQWDKNNWMKKISWKIAKNAKQKINTCPICNTKQSTKFFGWYGYSYLRCKKCELIYANRRLTEEKSLSFYSDDKDSKADYDADYIYTNKKYLKEREIIIKPKIDFIKKYSKGKKWLDIGSADGAAIQVLKKLKFDALGLEISPRSVNFAKKYRNVELIPQPLEEFAKENTKKWNVVSIIGVMDIIPNPMNILKTSHDLLAKNGIIAINVPNYESVSTAVQMNIKEPDRHLGNDIMRAYSLKSLKFALNKAGFETVGVWYFGMDTIELIRYIRTLNKKFENSEIDKILCSKINELQKVFDESHLGDQILIVGRKK
jgi:2-polyprenyl-3-methyl-5-hydroxy-6-metoxy-1,4-benzoquinol methylase